MPLISVIVPVYKVEPYLHRCVDSILAQTFTDFELILVDDGSPDNCGAICDEYAAKDSRIHVIHQQNGGLSAARNAGIDLAFAHSDSQWLSFIDSDDWVHPEYLDILYKAAAPDEIGIRVCGYCEPTETIMPVISPEQRSPTFLSPESLWCSNYVNATVAWGKLYRKPLFQAHRYPDGKIHEDEFITYLLLFSEKTIAYINAPLYCYFKNPSGIMLSSWKNARLAYLDAKDEQIRYFAENGFQDACHFTVQKYASWSIDKLNRLKAQTSIESQKGLKCIRRRLRRFISRHRNEFPSWKKREIYELVFPHIFQFYHFIGKLLGRHR